MILVILLSELVILCSGPRLLYMLTIFYSSAETESATAPLIHCRFQSWEFSVSRSPTFPLKIFSVVYTCIMKWTSCICTYIYRSQMRFCHWPMTEEVESIRMKYLRFASQNQDGYLFVANCPCLKQPDYNISEKRWTRKYKLFIDGELRKWQ